MLAEYERGVRELEHRCINRGHIPLEHVVPLARPGNGKGPEHYRNKAEARGPRHIKDIDDLKWSKKW